MVLLATIALIMPEVSIIPQPLSVTSRSGWFTFDPSCVIVGDAKPFEVLNQLFERASGFQIGAVSPGKKTIEIAIGNTREPLTPSEYRLEITPSKIRIESSDYGGAFYAVQTLRQLLPPEIESTSKIQRTWRVPCLSISDRPRYTWRGSLLDVSRHFFGVNYIKRYIDLLALHKMNVFHWHLIDDGGWRMQVDKYPMLTEIGAWRTDTGEVWPGGAWNMARLEFPGKESGKKLYGGFYRKAEIRDIVAYAKSRNVTVVPEIEMPGHSLPALAAYPELGCTDISKSGLPQTNVYCVGNDATIRFLEDVLDETIELFPSEFIHIGADEVWKGFWKNCERCQKRMKTERLKSEDELQSWFVRRMERYLASKGRRLIGWDEILEGGLAPGAAVMSWRGIAGGIEAARSGHDVVMSPTSHCYFDYPYSAISTQHAYSYEPTPAELTPIQARRVLGAQFNVWAEWIDTEQRLEEMVFPRMLAIAEATWSMPSRRDWVSFESRLAHYYNRLDALKVPYHIEAPMAPASSLFLSSTTLAPVASSRFPIHYTLDGSKPTVKSPLYNKPISVNRDCVITFAHIAPSGRTSSPVRVVCKKIVPYKPKGDIEPGLIMSKYLGTWSKLPEFDTLQPIATEKVDNVASASTPAENYGLRFRGYFLAEQDGKYSFTLGADDGAMLIFAGAPLIDNDGLHAYTQKTSTVEVKMGLYPIEIRYFQAGGAQRLTLEVTPPIASRASANYFFREK